jgi:hypothetical protein
LTEDEEADPPVPLRRILWLGPLAVLASIAAVVVVQVLAVGLLSPPSKFAPLGPRSDSDAVPQAIK